MTRTMTAQAMRDFSTAVLRVKGGSDENLVYVIDHLVDASLSGLEAHGIMRVSEYSRMLENGFIDGKAVPRVKSRAPGAFLVDGQNGFGQVAMMRAVQVMSDALEDLPMTAAGVTGVAHTGRIGAYAEALARKGCLAMIFGGGGHERYPTVAPFGGRRGVMSTNPVAFTIPGRDDIPVSVDFATATTAGGKLRYARDNGLELPEGHVIDKFGKPTRSPAAYFDGGTILSLAGPKGSGLGMIGELLGHALLGPAREFNWFLVAVKLAPFGDEAYDERAEAFLGKVNEIEPLEGFDSVLYPGQMEERARRRNAINGVPVSDGVLAEMQRLSGETGVAMPLFNELAA